MSSFCPVCKNKINDDALKCSICNFADLHREFITKEDAQEWFDNVVLPYRKQWEVSKKEVINHSESQRHETVMAGSNINDFDVFLNTLIKYKGNDKYVLTPSFIYTIYERAFANCECIERITMWWGVAYIEKYAFSNCKNLQTVNFSKNIIKIEKGAFEYCESLEEITIPSKVKKIEWNTFEGCKNLKKVYIHESVLEIEGNAFLNCPKLEIYCVKDSYAHKYAIENNIPVQFID